MWQLGEDKWVWQYKDEINKWEKSWFKNKSTCDDIKQRWRLQKNEIEKFGDYLSPFFASLHSSVTWLNNLKEEDFRIGPSVYILNKVALALQDGTKLKHLLMEEGYSQMEIAKAVS